MSSKWGWAAVVAFVGIFLLADVTLAQGRGGGRGRGGIVMLAGNEAVQKDLGVDDAAKGKLGEIIQSYGDEAREQFQSVGNFQDASNEERQQMMAKLAEMSQKLQAKYTPQLKEALSADQFKRLQQIGWQAAGATALADPDLAKALEISKEQTEKIAAVIRDYGEKTRGLFGSAGGDFQAIGAKVRELNQERDTKATEILSKDQQAKFTELKGKEFDLSQLQQFGRPGGRRQDN